ncbi:MAG TPA: hypothetical protein EYN07_03795 [Flavobacteriaceae bacterium]|jgi:hypothetical protein|nr:hypothetical protein [Flavobacteriaceae bacterium]HIN98344.1 hypothetical protein [Flavobacteriaceae bacterium]|tara:strand:+ start:175 stop:537 length:363 start_codon:yes stop_codon:yes gene_type:complete
MKTDNYTKVILTIIAICLTINVVKEINIFPKAHASETGISAEISNDYKLVPISENNTIDVRIVDINTYDEMNVNVKSIDSYDEMKVNIKSIDTSDEIDVNIDEVGGSYVSSGGPIKVKID